MRYPIAIMALVLVLLVALAYAAQLEAGAEVNATWDNETVDFDVELDNKGKAVDEVRIYVSGLDDVECKENSGWDSMLIENYPDTQLGLSDLCWYFSDDSLRGTETFSFSADAPAEKNPVDMKFEVREDGEGTGDIISFTHQFNWEVE